MDNPVRRRRRVAEAFDRIRPIAAAGPMTRGRLHRIKDILVDLAADQELFSLDEFPLSPGGAGAIYRLAQEPDDGPALYLQTAAPENSTPPHEHGTWAVVAGVSGQEANLLYDRAPSDDGSGGEQVTLRETVTLERGTAVSFLADDVHSIHGISLAVHLHLYGKPFEKMTDRVFFDPVSGKTALYAPHSGINERR